MCVCECAGGVGGVGVKCGEGIGTVFILPIHYYFFKMMITISCFEM